MPEFTPPSPRPPPEQHPRRVAGGARDRRVLAHERGGDGAVDQQQELQRQAVGVGDAGARQQLAEPLAAHLLEAQRNRVGGVLGVLELGHGVHEGAAAEALPGEGAFEAVEVVEDLLRRRLVGGRDQPHAALQVGLDQRVLARIVVVERALADAGLGRDRVDADHRALAVEQPVRRLEDAFGGRFLRAHGYTDLCTFWE